MKKMKATYETKAIIKSIILVGIPKGKKEKGGIKNAFEKIMPENFLNLKEETDIQEQEAQRVPNKMNSNKTYNKTNTIVKMAKVKETS